ncbi:MAG TPA: carboxypeptidase regulatory-like domain-containing protein [Terriglobales bacterium]|nr:carboxypeptidase regulatory-like domain-containing protein [Terriglobales bacterium]
MKSPHNLWARAASLTRLQGKLTPVICVLVLSTLLTAGSSSAQTLTGTIKNGTTGKPAAGDEVVLLSLMQGMQESGRTKADSKGNFSFSVPNDGSPHLVRVIHQGVTYHKMAPPGTTSVEAEVFDVAKKVEGLTVTADVMRVQAQNGQIEITRLFAVNNSSNPPKTQMNDHNFEFYLPDGAQVEQAMAKTAGGQPINASAVPQADKDRYAFIFPLRPGETQFQIAYRLPYSGEATLNPRTIYPLEHFVVMLPKAMQFSGPASFQSLQDPEQSDALVEVVSNAQPSQSIAFKVSGTGILPAKGDAGSAAGGTAATADTRPGGGLGPPIDAPDPLEKYRWYILAGFGVVLAAGAVYIARRSATQVSTTSLEDQETVELPRAVVAKPVSAPPAPSSTRPGLLLEALKEELFQLEVERQQGKISQQEYQKHKAALDQTLQRAIQRQAQNA